MHRHIREVIYVQEEQDRSQNAALGDTMQRLALGLRGRGDRPYTGYSEETLRFSRSLLRVYIYGAIQVLRNADGVGPGV